MSLSCQALQPVPAQELALWGSHWETGNQGVETSMKCSLPQIRALLWADWACCLGYVTNGMAAAPRGGQSKGLLPPEVPGCCQSALSPFDLEVFASPQALELLPPLHSKAHKCPIWLRVYTLSIYLCTHTHTHTT